mmetsp:Transcript_64432/g.73990  ORF Transcript_64432/g.73990 Transcript_64432/m.73990 type:complete len:187 (+) Transcript_64432:24-584(+)
MAESEILDEKRSSPNFSLGPVPKYRSKLSKELEKLSTTRSKANSIQRIGIITSTNEEGGQIHNGRGKLFRFEFKYLEAPIPDLSKGDKIRFFSFNSIIFRIEKKIKSFNARFSMQNINEAEQRGLKQSFSNDLQKINPEKYFKYYKSCNNGHVYMYRGHATLNFRIPEHETIDVSPDTVEDRKEEL